ncbi:MAG: decarboxylating 6-phosphogluconate dehydrogenase [Dehalococcoidia bacterium]
MSDLCDIGIIGLGTMGGNLARHVLEQGISVAGVDVGEVPDDLTAAGLRRVEGTRELPAALKAPRAVFIYVPAGPAVDSVIDEVADVLEAKDVIVDGGNSYWGDSVRRHERLRERGLGFVDLGTSGGGEGAREGACFMAGGDADAMERVEPVLRAIAVEGGFVHAGPPGSGHFVKLVHNGIEFGMLQAIGEGVALLEAFFGRDDERIRPVLEVWRHGSVIRSWLIDLMAEAYREHGGLADIPPYVEDTGEVNWLVTDAIAREVPIPVISQSVMALLASRDQDQPWARAVAAMRHGFGGHPFGPDAGIARERRQGRVGPFMPPETPDR